MKTNIFLLTKITIGFIIAFLIAYFLKLPYFYTTGVITLLSLEKTKLRSYNIALIRLISMIIAFALGSLLFYLFDFETLGVVFFILIFIPLSFFTKIEKGLSVSLVLVSQIYLEKDLTFTLNAFYIFFIGVGVGLILNLIMPNYRKEISKNTKLIDEEINTSIKLISTNIKPDFTNLKKLTTLSFSLIQDELENMSSLEITKTLNYLEMRNKQSFLLEKISNDLMNVTSIEEKSIILNYLQLFENQIGESNYALNLNDQLDKLFELFQKRPLPKERSLFEQRALLYTTLLDLKQFLKLKLDYHLKYQNESAN